MNRRETVFAMVALGAAPLASKAAPDNVRGTASSGVPGGLVNGLWTPRKDATRNITTESWAELPLNTVIEWAGTALESQLKAPYGIAAGKTFTDWGVEGISGHFDDYSGMAFDPATGRFWGFGGGHAGSSNNMLSQFDARTGLWSVSITPTANEFMPSSYAKRGTSNYTSVVYPNGRSYNYFPSTEAPPGDDKPCATHTYSGSEYVGGEVVKIRKSGGGRYEHATVDAAAPKWSFGGTPARNTGGIEIHAAAYNGVLYWGMEGGQVSDNQYWTITKYNPATRSEAGTIQIGRGVAFTDASISALMTNGLWFVAELRKKAWIVLDLASGGSTHSSGALSGRVPGFNANWEGGLGCAYVPDLGKIVMLSTWAPGGGAAEAVWTTIDPATGVCATSTILDTFGKTPPLGGSRGIYNRIRYWPTHKALVLHSRTMNNARVVRFG